jgi:hypothetical protein
MAEFFGELEAAGAEVLVCPGNHDINNPHAMAYDGDVTFPVPGVSPQEFRTIYNNFGFGQALAVDTSSLSYVAEPVPGLQVISIDVCRYDSNYINNYPQTSGGFTPQLLQWVKDRIIDAKSMGKVIIAMQHHNMVEHFTNQKSIFSEYVIDDWETVYGELADLGLKVIFTGHFHAQDIRAISTPAGNQLHDIETGSTVTWPCPYRIMTLTQDSVLNITGKRIENINYNTGSLTFQQYALEQLETGLPASIIHYLTSPPFNLSQGTAEFLEPAFTETLIAHYQGNEGSPSFSTNMIIITLYLTGYGYIAEALESVWDDFAPDDWNTSIDLAPEEGQLVLDLSVMLEGPFNGSDMNTSLNQEFLPRKQPYLSMPWLFTGHDSVLNIINPDIVDWVLVEIRDAANAESATPDKKAGRQVAFLKNDGAIVGLDGTSPLKFRCQFNNQLFVVIAHRNHLAVMSGNPLISSGGIYSYHFETGENQAYGGIAAQTTLGSGMFGLMSGDGNADCIVTEQDKTGFWSIVAGKKGYLPGDYNMDGNVNNPDKNKCWWPNLGNESQVPE